MIRVSCNFLVNPGVDVAARSHYTNLIETESQYQQTTN